MDIFDPGYVGRIFAYIFMGLLDAMWQTTAYWIMGAMSNDPAKLAHFVGFCMFQDLLVRRDLLLRFVLSVQINPSNRLGLLDLGEWTLLRDRKRSPRRALIALD